MKKEYGKVLRDTFQKRLAAEFPEFKPLTGRQPYLFSGEKAYIKELEDVWLVVLLSPQLTGHESFTIELGWSRQKRFPELGMRPNIEPGREREHFGDEEAMLRLSRLVGGPDHWPIEPEADPLGDPGANLAAVAARPSAAEARDRVTPVLDAAFEHLRTSGMALFDAYLEHNE